MTNVKDSKNQETMGDEGAGVHDVQPSVPVGQPDDLHDLFAVPDDPEDPLSTLRHDPNYTALIAELEAIAKAARQLFEPTEEPSDAVWDKIQSKLKSEGTE